MERGPRRPDISRETLELLECPEEVFDSEPDKAEHQSQEVIERLIRAREISRRSDEVRLDTIETGRTTPPVIEIFWPDKPGALSALLRLTPMSEGKGFESGVFGYTGAYGAAVRKGSVYSFVDNGTSLEETFGVPEELSVIVKPTIDRWAIESNAQDRTIFGENVRTLYMGLGFLFLGREWMFVGMHESGHLPDNDDENVAWNIASRRYARAHKARKEGIVSGEDTGEFDLLKRPILHGGSPTAGDIIRYGLTSHARNKNAKLPSAWAGERMVENTIEEFKRLILRANGAYEDLIGR